MKCELDINQLKTAVSTVRKALTSRAQLPILKSIKIEVKKKSCILSATDLFIGIEVVLDAAQTIDGCAIVPGKQFIDLISSLNQGKVVLEKKKEQLVVRSTHSQAKFSLFSIDEYPEFPKVVGEETSLPLSLLDEVEKKTFFSVSTDHTRPVLTGVLFNPNGEFFSVVTTDGFRLSKIEIRVSLSLPSGLNSLLIPAQSLKEVINVAKDMGVEVVKLIISTAEKQLLFRVDKVRIFVRLLDGDYPPYQKIIPQSFTNQLQLNREELLSHIKRALIFCQDSSSIVHLKFNDDLIVSAISNSAGQYEGRMEVEKATGSGGEIAFNGRYLLDFLSSNDSEIVIFEMVEALKPAVFRWPEEDGIYVVMPFRVTQ